MIIDKILDRKDGYGYIARDFYHEMLAYESIDMSCGVSISSTMDYGTEDDVKSALCKYIDKGEYNPRIKDYIKSVKWLEDDTLMDDLRLELQEAY